MSQTEEIVHPARVDALSRKVETIRSDLMDEIEELQEENRDLRQRVSDLENKLEIIGADGMDPNTPDKRALQIRAKLYELANKGTKPTAAMDHNDVNVELPGLSREQRYEAMRRAAGGNDLAHKGQSSLSPVQGIQWEARDGRNNRVTLDLELAEERLGRRMIRTEEGDDTE